MHDEWKTPAITEGEAFERLMGIVRILRVECPWDREQDHASIRKGMLEEAYEVAEAIDNEDMANLREELGDVLLQVVFHSILAEEETAFTAVDLINEECEKMIRRHPHVFLEEEAKTVDKVLEKWENIKVLEHGESTPEEQLAGVPHALPALIRSYKVQKKAEQCGCHWVDGSTAWGQVGELSRDLVDEDPMRSSEDVERKVGDVLFAVVQAARKTGVEPERALELATERFIEEFAAAVKEAEQRGLPLDEVPLLRGQK